jgi:hypothetical protein
MGKWIWTRTGYNVATGDIAAETYLGGSGVVTTDSGDFYHGARKNLFNEGTWLQAEDFVLREGADHVGARRERMDTGQDCVAIERGRDIEFCSLRHGALHPRVRVRGDVLDRLRPAFYGAKISACQLLALKNKEGGLGSTLRR